MKVKGSRTYIALAASIILVVLGIIISTTMYPCLKQQHWLAIGIIVIVVGVALGLMTFNGIRNKSRNRQLSFESTANGTLKRAESKNADDIGFQVNVLHRSTSGIDSVFVAVVPLQSNTAGRLPRNISTSSVSGLGLRNVSTSSVPGDLRIAVNLPKSEDPDALCSSDDNNSPTEDSDKSRLLSRSLPNVSGVLQPITDREFHIYNDFCGSPDLDEQVSLRLREKTINCLTREQIENFAVAMDSDTDVWKSFGHKVAEISINRGERLKSFKLRVNHCETNYNYGGGPSKKLFKYMETQMPNFLVADFAEIAENNGRNDISKYINENDLLKDEEGEHKHFSEIDHEHHRTLACRLDTNVRQNWKRFAQCLNFSEGDINDMELTCNKSHECSPTSRLFKLFKNELPKLTLDVIYTSLKCINRNDLASDLEKLFRNS